jgi:cell division transport system ATP-binding protein
LVRFQNVGLRYGLGPEILQDISFRLASGSFHFLTGPSGAGKSSILRMLYLGLRPSSGSISLFDQDVVAARRRDLPELRRRIGVVFQDFRLLDHLSVIDNVALPLRIAGQDVAKSHDHIVELLVWVGLADRLHARPPALSGGEQQRVAIARAVIARPRLLLADEPTGSVDPELGRRLMRLFIELHKLGTTVLIATHDERLIAPLEMPVLRLTRGQLTFEGATA